MRVGADERPGLTADRGAMATFTATTYGTGDELRHVTDVNGRHLLVTDEPEAIGGTDDGPAPHELLPATLSACIATMLSLYAKRRGLDTGDIRVDVDYDTETTPRRLDVTVCMPPGFPDDDLGRLMRVVQSCPVKQAFEAGFVINENVEMPALD
jgi:putative redox protein